MGYSHYLAFFASHKDPASFAEFIEDVRKIIENAPEGADLCGRNENDPPIINDQQVIFGCKSNLSPFSKFKVNLHHRAVMNRYPMVVLKTDRHPYDSVVCACILSFVHHFPAADATSDGTKEDWKLGVSLYEFSTERKAPEIHLREK